MANNENTTSQTTENGFGLTQRDMDTLQEIFHRYVDIETVVIFGSRAKGHYKPGSDIDLAIMNTGLDPVTVRKANSDCEESSLPYRVDLIDYHTIVHAQLKAHIDRIGLPFYQK